VECNDTGSLETKRATAGKANCKTRIATTVDLPLLFRFFMEVNLGASDILTELCLQSSFGDSI
jgi:hypothetical protein